MQVPVPDAPDPPTLGQIIVWLFYGSGIAIAAVLARLGFMQGKRVPEPGTDQAEIAGAVISDSKANAIVEAIRAQTAAMLDETTSNRAIVATAASLAIALDKNTDALERIRDEIGDTRIEVGALSREMARRGR